MVDPALKGTRFGDALEAAERDEQLKRERRAAETNGGSAAHKARGLAEFLRGHTAEFIQNDHSKGTQTMTDIAAQKPYTNTEIKILADGMDHDVFQVPSGTHSVRLLKEDLIKKLSPGRYEITEKGREMYHTILRENTIPSASPATPPTQSSGSTDLEIGALKLQLKQVTELANDRAGKIDDLKNTIAELERQIQPSRGNSIFSDDVDAWLKDYRTCIADIETIRDKQKKDQLDDLSILAYVSEIRRQVDELDEKLQHLKHINPEIYNQVQGQITLIGHMMTEDQTLLSVVDYVADLRRKAATVDQAGTQVEALRREIDEYKIAVDEWQRRFKAADKNYLAALILAELCDLLPEIEAYRQAREAAVEAINTLKARRS